MDLGKGGGGAVWQDLRNMIQWPDPQAMLGPGQDPCLLLCLHH